MNIIKLSIFALAATFVATPILVYADGDGELEEAELFFELNDTDGDLGIHGFADGNEWKELEIEDPYGREMMEVEVNGRLKRQGVTELFFESAEPTFDELRPKHFFRRFPQGVYEIEVETLDGEELGNEVYLSHIIPAAPAVIEVGGNDEAPGEDDEGDAECWEATAEANGDVIVVWEAVTESHAYKHREGGDDPREFPLGKDGPFDVINYEFVVEVDETPWKTVSIIPPDAEDVNGDISKTIAADFFELTADDEEDVEYKFEILVRIDNGEGNPGNKSAVEACFEVD